MLHNTHLILFRPLGTSGYPRNHEMFLRTWSTAMGGRGATDFSVYRYIGPFSTRKTFLRRKFIKHGANNPIHSFFCENWGGYGRKSWMHFFAKIMHKVFPTTLVTSITLRHLTREIFLKFSSPPPNPVFKITKTWKPFCGSEVIEIVLHAFLCLTLIRSQLPLVREGVFTQWGVVGKGIAST